MTRRQQLCWAFCAASVPAVMICAGLGWTRVLAGSAAAACVYAALLLPGKQAGRYAENLIRLFGPVGKTLLWLTALWTVLAAGRALSVAQRAFPEDQTHLLCAISLTALSAFAAWKGRRTGARCMGLFAMGLGALYFLLTLAALGSVRQSWCAPWGGRGDTLTAFCAMLTPSAALLLPPEKEDGRFPLGALALLTFCPAGAALLTSGCLSPQVAQSEQIAFYTLAKSLSILSVVQRAEPIVSAALYLGLFSLVTFLTQAGASAAAQAVGEKEKRGFCLAANALAFALSFAVGRLPEAFWAGGTSIFWGLLPLVTQFVGGAKKYCKKTKKVVDKPETRGYNDQAF